MIEPERDPESLPESENTEVPLFTAALSVKEPKNGTNIQSDISYTLDI